MKLHRIAFIPDQHIPYNDPKAWALNLKVIRNFRPDTVYTMGDFGDFYCTSRHPKHPGRSRDLETEVSACNARLDELDRACAAISCTDKRFLMGNHEQNLERYLIERAPELFNLVNVEDLFDLYDRGWKVTKYKDYDRIGKLYATHDTGPTGRDAHIKSQADIGSNIVIGHTHRMAVHYSSTIVGKHHVAMMCGWGGDAKLAEYMYKCKTKDWQLGMGVGYMEPNGTVHLVPVPYVDYRCILNGVVIQ